MTCRIVTLIGILALLVMPVMAQEAAPIESPIESLIEPTEPQLPSRENNFNLPKDIVFDGEIVTEGTWVIRMCGTPIVAVYDNDTQMAVPLIGPPLQQFARQKSWELEDGPPLLVTPDLEHIYAPIAEMCQILRARKSHDNEQVEPPKTRMK